MHMFPSVMIQRFPFLFSQFAYNTEIEAKIEIKLSNLTTEEFPF